MTVVHPSLAKLSERQATDYGEATAIRFAGIDHSYADMHERTLIAATDLHATGIRRGDRVAYLGPNHPAAVVTLLACFRLGAIFIPLNWRLAPAELDFQLTNADVSLLLVAPELTDTAAALTVDVPTEAVRWDPAPASARGPIIPAAEVDGSDPALLLFTSGTTGRPKGAVLTHANLLWNSFNLLLNTDLTASDATLVAAPLFHVIGLNQQVLTSYLRGARILLEAKWDPDRAFDAIDDEGLTWMAGVTTMFADLLHSPRWETTDLTSLRFVNSGGAPIPVALIHAFQDRDILFCQGYGLTETSPGATFLPGAFALAKPGSAGRAVPFTEVAVRDLSGNPCEAGQTGEIVVRGPNVMTGYWDNPAATEAAFSPGGWFHTGDIGYLDTDGFLFIVDRLKDMFISGGENVYPAEVESVLFEHPAVAETAIVAADDDRWGEVGHAFVVAAEAQTPDPEELREFLLARLAKYKVPKYFDIVDSLPRTGSGKVHKGTLRRTGPLGAHSTATVQTVAAPTTTAPTKDAP
ncbi:acyl-CoA synthetase [Brevibacterium casei]|uniref:Long-chain fatty acid--CoA ligase n=1 Tax=Brevibacterium casei TaxID=33889 RepID=A0A449D7W0_9MICO|nr:long-chain fatty acid--CoA ligase [Brevibacterium casei]QPS34006.1 long-chain fatty acid--CoA ligase [Brevibacterium casei]VEW13687.1 Short-chain-fatty-acid--CoA ligase [Brevibacterium casei]